ncbi:MAG: pilus assembly protein N-terminal domain-containing protein [Sporomusaceae bacterium]|nr:pilus assembly protein N-terminal domain-containing protein [Sporomusaceae bacterium]
MKSVTVKVIALMMLCLLLQVAPAAANQKIAVAVSQSQVVSINGVERVAVANPEVADVIVVSGVEMVVVGKQPGVTTLHIWSAAGRASYDVEVGTNDTQIANDIRAILGYDDIRVSKVGKNVILEGSVNDQYQKMRAEKVAGAYGEKVVNLLEIIRPVQVKIEARVIEVNRNNKDDLGIQWGNDPTKPGTFLFGQGIANSVMGNRTLGNMGGYSNIYGALSALIKNGNARILSQPNLITLSGEKANILVGGEIPIPVSVKDGAVTVEWKEFGIKLEIAPEVNRQGLINSKIKAEVSTPDWSSGHKIGISANFQVPPINTRKAEASIALSSGQTMALGGLIANEVTKDVYKLPLLGNIPVLGKLFTSTSFSRGETELIILITPTVVNPQEYVPNMSPELQEKVIEDPWGGKKSGGKN